MDAAFFEDTNSMGIRIVLRDHTGNFFAAKTLPYPGKLPIIEGEMLGIRKALSWLGVHGVKIVSDSRTACEAVESTCTDSIELGILAKECRSLLNSKPDFKLQYIKRELNDLAHSLAR